MKLSLTAPELRLLRRIVEVLRVQGSCWQSIAFDLDRTEREALPAVMDSLTRKLEKAPPAEIRG